MKRVDLGIISLIPDLLISVLGLQIDGATQLPIFSNEMLRSVGAGIVRRPVGSTLFCCCTMLISSQREAPLWSAEQMKSWAVCCDIWLLFTDATPPPPSRKKPAAGMDTRLGSKVEALACLSQRSSARHFQSSGFGFKPLPLPWPPPAVFMSQLCPCVCFDGGDGRRLVPTGSGVFQPPLPVHPSLYSPPRPSS